MADYLDKRKHTEKLSWVTGLGLTVLAHACLVVFGVFSGIKYLYPPPQEQTFLIDFTEPEPEPVLQEFNGTLPQSEEIDRSKPLELVQRSESPVQGKNANEAPEAKVDDFGDVEVKDPEPPKKEINQRALFRAADNKTDKDTLAPQTASRVSDALKAGHASGNTQVGKTNGAPNAHLKGRSVVGTLPSPNYNVQESGTVVVKIWVDQYGTVTKAIAGADGTTVTDSRLWTAARNAAMGAHFNQSVDAPALQEGTITYIFSLK